MDKESACMQESPEMRVQSLGWEDPLEKGIAIPLQYSCWRIPWTEEPGGLQSIGSQRVRHDDSDNMHTHKYNIALILRCFRVTMSHTETLQ